MALSTMKTSSGTGTECGGHESAYGSGSARRSFMKLAAATATLTGLAMTARMTVKVIAADHPVFAGAHCCKGAGAIDISPVPGV